MYKLANLKEGDRVIFTGSHPWATHAGTVIAWEFVELHGINLPKIRLDNGHTVFAFNAAQVRVTESARP